MASRKKIPSLSHFREKPGYFMKNCWLKNQTIKRQVNMIEENENYVVVMTKADNVDINDRWWIDI